jgi:hypothetical protein
MKPMETTLLDADTKTTNMAFKEWAIVCEEMGAGRQSLILRKGGIAEGRKGFSFEHESFFLFPTWFHEQVKLTTLPPGTVLPPAPEDSIEIRFCATVEWARLVTDWDQILALADYHCYSEKALRDRFDYDEPKGIHVAYVRVFRIEPAAQIPNEKRYGGCRSWTSLLPEISGARQPILSDQENTDRQNQIRKILGETA